MEDDLEVGKVPLNLCSGGTLTPDLTFAWFHEIFLNHQSQGFRLPNWE